jgi:hypothetical protein
VASNAGICPGLVPFRLVILRTTGLALDAPARFIFAPERPFNWSKLVPAVGVEDHEFNSQTYVLAPLRAVLPTVNTPAPLAAYGPGPGVTVPPLWAVTDPLTVPLPVSFPPFCTTTEVPSVPVASTTPAMFTVAGGVRVAPL